MPVEADPTTQAAEVEAQVSALIPMDLGELREFWRARWGPEPKMRSIGLLRLIVAWRVQAEVEGGLRPETRRRLRSRSIPRTLPPPVGACLTREYRGVLHNVEVGDGVFHYAGRSFGSLSQVAREITGTRWNGPRFFGLRPGADA